jgi:hypothetical protein
MGSAQRVRAPARPAHRGRKRGADVLRVGDAPARKEFLFLFDYGDEWHFGVKLVRSGEVEPGARYPRVLAGQGEAPPQYPDLDDEDDWDEDLISQFPPVELAPLPQLQAAAAAAPTVRRLRALVEWLGEGRKLTGAGNLTLADGKELARLLGLADADQLAGLRVRSAQDIAGLALLVDWAKQLRLARVHRGRLVPVKQHRRLLDEPLELFFQAAAVLPLVDRALPLTSMIDSSFPRGLAEALLDLLSLLYGAEKPVTVGGLTGHFWEDHVEAVLDEQAASRLELLRLATAVEAAQYLGLLRELGMVDLGGGNGAEPAVVAVNPGAAGSADAYLSSLAELTVRLTPLGTWWTNVLLRQAGAVAPVIGELASADPATLIEGVSGYDERALRAELRAWCRERGAGAARELADYLRTAPDLEQRLLALVGLSEAGPAAEAEVRSMLADPELRPLARIWLAGRGVEDAASLDPASARCRWPRSWPRSCATPAPPGWLSTWSGWAPRPSRRPSSPTCGGPAPRTPPPSSRPPAGPIPTLRSPRRPARPPSSSAPRGSGETSCCRSP